MTFVPVERTAEIVQERQRLPIFTLESEIIEQLSSSNVLLICGETGSGKTTQVPQFLWEHGYGHPQGKHRGLIGVTEPRRLAATSVCARVAEELGESGKGTVAYQIRYESTFQKGKTRLKFMTDGILLRELENDPLLWDYSVIIIDEAHDRAVNTDILLGCLSRVISIREKIVDLSKQIGQKASGSGVENRMFEDLNHLYGLTRDKIDTVLRSKNNFDYLKLIVMSATLQVEIFAQNKLLFPQQVPVIRIPGRQYPIVIHFNRITPPDCISAALDKVIKIHSRLPSGDILVFMPGRVEVEELTRRLRQTFPQNEHIGRKTSIKKKQIEQKDNQGKILSSDNKDVDYGLFVSDEEFEKFANDNFHIDVEIDDNDDKNTEMDKNESFNEQLITEQIIEKDFIINNKNENEGGITFDDNEDDILEKQKPLKRKRGGKKHHHNIINIETSIEEKSEQYLHSSTKNKRRRFIEEEDYFNKVETKNLDKEQLNQLASEQGDMNHNVNQDEYQEEENVIVLNASIMTQEQLEKEKEMGNINLNGIIQDDDEEDQYSSSNSESYYTNKQKMKLKRIETDSTEEKQQQKKKKQKRNKLGQKYLIVYPLYSLLPSYLQRRIFNQEKENDFVRKVIVATNIAETSLTIPGIRYVVDSGLVKERIYNSVTGVITLQAVWESVASADQRAGRAGRVGPGHCYRLFSSSVQQNIFSKYSQPELLRMPLDHVLLSIISMTQSQTEDEQIKQPFSLFQSVRDFPFPTPPAMDDIDNALTLLRNLGAIQIQKKELKDQFTNQNNHKSSDQDKTMIKHKNDDQLNDIGEEQQYVNEMKIKKNKSQNSIIGIVKEIQLTKEEIQIKQNDEWIKKWTFGMNEKLNDEKKHMENNTKDRNISLIKKNDNNDTNSNIMVQKKASLKHVICVYITRLGRQMVWFPIGPRYSRILVAAMDSGEAPLALAIVAAASVRELFISFIPSRKDNDEDKESDDDKESDEESNIETLNQKLLRQSSKKENRVSKKLEKEQKHVESQFQALVHAFWSSKAFGSDLLAEMAALQYFAQSFTNENGLIQKDKRINLLSKNIKIGNKDEVEDQQTNKQKNTKQISQQTLSDFASTYSQLNNFISASTSSFQLQQNFSFISDRDVGIEEWCTLHFIRLKAVEEAQMMRVQLARILSEITLNQSKLTSSSTSYSSQQSFFNYLISPDQSPLTFNQSKLLRQCITCGFVDQIAVWKKIDQINIYQQQQILQQDIINADIENDQKSRSIKRKQYGYLTSKLLFFQGNKDQNSILIDELASNENELCDIHPHSFLSSYSSLSHMLTSSTSSSSGHSKKGKYSNRSQCICFGEITSSHSSKFLLQHTTEIDPTWLHYIVPLELLSPAKVVSDSSYPPPIQYLQSKNSLSNNQRNNGKAFQKQFNPQSPLFDKQYGEMVGVIEASYLPLHYPLPSIQLRIALTSTPLKVATSLFIRAILDGDVFNICWRKMSDDLKNALYQISKEMSMCNTVSQKFSNLIDEFILHKVNYYQLMQYQQRKQQTKYKLNNEMDLKTQQFLITRQQSEMIVPLSKAAVEMIWKEESDLGISIKESFLGKQFLLLLPQKLWSELNEFWPFCNYDENEENRERKMNTNQKREMKKMKKDNEDQSIHLSSQLSNSDENDFTDFQPNLIFM